MASPEVIFRIQRRIGWSMLIGLLLAILLNFLNLFTNQTLLQILFSPNVLVVAVFIVPTYLSTVHNSNFLRGLQVLIFFLLGFISIYMNREEPGSMTEVYFLVCGIILCLQYNYLKKHFVLKILLLLSLFTLFKLGILYVYTPENFMIGISPILLAFVFFYIIWVAFAEELKLYVQETRELKLQIDKDQVFVAFGKNVGGVTHNLRSKIMAIQSFNEIIDDSGDEEIKEYCQLQQNVINDSFELIRNLMQAVKAKQDPRQQVIALHEIIRSVVALFDSNSQFHKEVAVTQDLSEEDYIFMSPLDASQMMENLLRNSWEARGERDLLEVTIRTTREDNQVKVVIADNGVGIKLCAECHKQEVCNNCPHFHIGKSTKKEGSGFGMIYIMNLLQQYDGNIKLRSRPERGTEITLLFPARENNKEYFID